MAVCRRHYRHPVSVDAHLIPDSSDEDAEGKQRSRKSSKGGGEAQVRPPRDQKL